MILEEYFEHAYITCVHYFVNKKIHWTEKLFWVLCIPVCIICAYLVVFTTIKDYNDQIASYTVDTSYLDWVTPFPSVIICELKNDVKLKKMLSDWFPKDKNFDEKVDSLRTLAFYQGSLENVATHLNHPDEVVNNNFSYYTNKIRATCVELLSTCLYNGVKFECCEGFVPVETIWGQCYSINNKFNKYQGKKNTFWIKRGVHEGLGNISFELRKSEVAVGIFSINEVLSWKSLKSMVIDSLSSNFEYTIYIKVIEVVTSADAVALPVEKRQCRYSHENNLKRFPYYSKSNCEIECLINAQLKYCGCFAHVLPTSNATIECNLKGLDCTLKHAAEINELLKSCFCLNACTELEVYFVGSVPKSPTEHSPFLEKWAEVRVNIIVPAPSLRYYRTVVKGPVDLLVSVCGALGLFLGCSLMTLVQFFYYFLIRPLEEFVRSWRMKNQNESKQFKNGKHTMFKSLQNPNTVIYQPQYYICTGAPVKVK